MSPTRWVGAWISFEADDSSSWAVLDLVQLDTITGGIDGDDVGDRRFHDGGRDSDGSGSDDGGGGCGSSSVIWNRTVLDRFRPDTRTGSGVGGGCGDDVGSVKGVGNVSGKDDADGDGGGDDGAGNGDGSGSDDNGGGCSDDDDGGDGSDDDGSGGGCGEDGGGGGSGNDGGGGCGM